MDNPRRQALKDELDHFDEADLCALAGITKETATNWRAKRIGPEFVKFGNSILYPKAAVREYLKTNLNTTLDFASAAGIPR